MTTIADSIVAKLPTSDMTMLYWLLAGIYLVEFMILIRVWRKLKKESA